VSRRPPADPAWRQRSWVPRAAGLLAALIGLVDVVSAVVPAVRNHVVSITGTVPGTVAHAAAALTAVAGVLLLLAAHALRRRKRRAWRVVVVLLVLSVVTHLVKGPDYGEVAVSLLLLAGLVWYRQEFYAVPDPRSRWSALTAFFGVTAIGVGVGAVLIAVHADALAGRPGWGPRLQYIVEGMAGITGPLQFTNQHVTDLVGDVLVAFGVLVLLTTVYVLLRPSQPVCRLTASDADRVRDLLSRHGARDSLGYFALRGDKAVVWSPTAKACVAFRVVNGVMLASGDPLGDPEAWPGAIQAFLAEAHRHAWVPAVMGCSEQGGEIWARTAGLEALEIGDEAVLHAADFCLAGRAMRNVRQAVARVERAGYTCRVQRTAELSAAEVRRLHARAQAWRDARKERGFSMALGRLGDPADQRCVVVTALDSVGEVRALLHFVPWGEDGLSLDLMRRDRSAENGVNEFLIVRLMQAAPDLGVCRVSLNFAAFRSTLARGERLGAGPIVRLLRRALLFLSRWFQIESLYRFNAKFGPAWQPRFLCYRGTPELPRVVLAVLEAEAFIARPRLQLQVAR
jgi:lysyl-tRNA synthetase class 2